jgi:hypothetical protein
LTRLLLFLFYLARFLIFHSLPAFSLSSIPFIEPTLSIHLVFLQQGMISFVTLIYDLTFNLIAFLFSFSNCLLVILKQVIILQPLAFILRFFDYRHIESLQFL